MNAFFHLLAPLALMLPAATAVDRARSLPEADAAQLAVPSAPMSHPAGSDPMAIDPYFLPGTAQQVRIEERVTIRIAPRSMPMPMMPSMFAQDLEAPAGGPRYIEKKMGKCVPVAAIIGVQPGAGNRLIMMMKDRRVVSAALSKSCQSRDYYSGFLVAKSADGMICQGRDQLLARNGANCQVSGFRQIIEVGD